MTTVAMLAILVVPAAMAAVLVVFRVRLRRAAGWCAGAASLLTVVASFVLLGDLNLGHEPVLVASWVPSESIVLGLHLDWISFPFLLTETIVTLVAIVYAWGYHHTDERSPLFYALLLVFGIGMSGTTLADDMVLFYTFWELMLVASAVLILVWGDAPPGGPSRRAVTLKYFIITHLGSLMVLIGLLTIYNAVGTDTFSALRAGHGLPFELIPMVTVFFLIGFSVKMAVFPLHIWLPDAHTVAPMPVTIMLAAAMLSMGTYGILRFPFSLFTREQLGGFAVPLMIVGIVSEIYGALMALAEEDTKRVVAYSSVSQMGYILFGLGTLTQAGIAGATLQVIYHAIVKALLFMVVGLVVHGTGRRRLGELGGLGKLMPVTAVCGAIGTLAIAGTPPLCLFDSEWMIFTGGFASGHTVLAAVAVLGSLLTVAYALWFYGRIFFGQVPEGLHAHRGPWALLTPTVLLATLAVVEGIFPAPVFVWVSKQVALLLGGMP